MSAYRGLSRRLARFGRFERIVLDNHFDTSPTYAPLHMKPVTTAPTDVAEGDVYYDGNVDSVMFADATGFVPVGGKRVVKTGAATLTAADSGALCLFNAAAGFTYTLPAARAGLTFDFLVTTTVTSSVARIACASGDFLLGTIIQGTDGTYTQAAQSANGTTHLAWEGNGGTTGGYVGDTISVTAISDSQWAVSGYNRATGTEATPFKTS